MTYIPWENDWEPAMRYEGIAMYTFNCTRGNDPYDGIADAGFFDGNFIPTLTADGLNAMNCILEKLITDSKNDKKQIFDEIKKSLSIGMEQEKSIELLDYITLTIKE